MNILTLGDISNGSDLILWITFMLFAIISIVLLSGHGSGLIAGYNTAGKEEQGKYDVKKLCRIIGIGMGIVAVLFYLIAILESVLPAYFAYIALAIIILDCICIIILANTICKK